MKRNWLSTLQRDDQVVVVDGEAGVRLARVAKVHHADARFIYISGPPQGPVLELYRRSDGCRLSAGDRMTYLQEITPERTEDQDRRERLIRQIHGADLGVLDVKDLLQIWITVKNATAPFAWMHGELDDARR